jgi:hypothetical protein
MLSLGVSCVLKKGSLTDFVCFVATIAAVGYHEAVSNRWKNLAKGSEVSRCRNKLVRSMI